MEHQCEKSVWVTGSYHSHQCVRNGTVERNGKWYCGTHDPVKVAEREKTRDAKWEKKWAIDKANTRWIIAANKLCSGVDVQTMEKLGAGWLLEQIKMQGEPV